MHANKAYVIGLTGGIGCGKSEAARFLKSLGAAHVDADAISRTITAPGGEALPEIRRQFGPEVFNEDGTLNRARMAGIVFENETARRILEGITHPLIQRTMLMEMDEAARIGYRIIILDVPLLFETGMDALCDESWALYASREVQIARVMERDDVTRAQAEVRIDSQMSTEERNARASRAINTDRPIERTQAELSALYHGALKKITE